MNNHIDFVSKQAYTTRFQDQTDEYNKRLQNKRWRVLLGTFFVLVLIANAFIWMRPSLYQSQAILHFSYANGEEQVVNGLANQQISFHSQRLISNSVLGRISLNLLTQYGIDISVKTLRSELSLEPNFSGHLITLKAVGKSGETLDRIVNTWIVTYLDIVKSESKKSSRQSKDSSQTQLLLLEDKIQLQKQALETYGRVYGITSFERDEHPTLNKVKNISLNLDNASSVLTEKQALLKTLKSAVANNESLVRPSDQDRIEITKSTLNELNTNLAALSEKFTQAYLERDPEVVASQQEARKMKALLAEQISDSEKAYVLDTQRDVDSAQNKVEDLQQQLATQRKLAQSFNQKLEQFKVLDSELEALQFQAQEIKSRQVQKEVINPYEVKINVLEKPFTSGYPVGPNNINDSLLSVGISAVVAVIALLIYAFIAKQKTPNNVANNYFVVPHQAVHSANTSINHETSQTIGQREHIATESSHVNLALAEPLLTVKPQLRLLTHNDCLALYNAATLQGKLVLELILSGISPTELVKLKVDNFEDDFSLVVLSNPTTRKVMLSSTAQNILSGELFDLNTNASIWTGIIPESELTSLIINTAYDARLSSPETITLSDIRHTYIMFLARQGMKLNDIPSVAGAIPPSQLAEYRDTTQSAVPPNNQPIVTQYPLGEYAE